MSAPYVINPASDGPLTLNDLALNNGVPPDLFWAGVEPELRWQVPGQLLSTTGRRAGWHKLPVDVAMLVDAVLDDTKNALGTGRTGSVDPALLGPLDSLTSTENFPEWLTNGYVLLPEAYVFPYSGDDAVLLQILSSCGGDLECTANTLGPVALTAFQTTSGFVGSPAASPFGQFKDPEPQTVTANPLFRPVTAAQRTRFERDMVTTLRNSTTSAYVGITQVPHMFGNLDEKTSEFHFAWWTIENSTLASGWQAFAAPFETMTSAWYSGLASQEIIELLDSHGDQLSTMNSSFQDALRALKTIENEIRDLTAATSPVGGKAETDLETILDDYGHLHDGAPQVWQQEHHTELDRRRDHIRQKQQQLVRAVAPLRAALTQLPLVRAWLAGIHNGDASSLDLLNPAVWNRLGAAGLQTNALVAEAFLSGARPVQRRPPTPQIDWDALERRREEEERLKETLSDEEWDEYYERTYGGSSLTSDD